MNQYACSLSKDFRGAVIAELDWVAERTNTKLAVMQGERKLSGHSTSSETQFRTEKWVL